MPKGLRGFQNGHPQFNTGKTHFTKGHKVRLGKYHSEETKKKISKANKGRKHTEEAKRKISIASKGHIGLRGDKSPRWKGGIQHKKAYNKQWQKEHSELVSYYSRQRYYRKRGADGSHTITEWETLKMQYNWTCPICKKSEPEIKLEEDHIIPIIKGGSNNIENIQPLCRSCNAKKYTSIMRVAIS